MGDTSGPRGSATESPQLWIPLLIREPGALRVEVDDQGEPQVYVGRPGSGVTAVLSRHGLDLWAGGNVVASVRAGAEGGVLELGDGAGRRVVRLPAQG